jgi:hypothetical protein
MFRFCSECLRAQCVSWKPRSASYDGGRGRPRILLLPCRGNILLLRSEAGRTESGREPTFLLGRLECT